MATLIFDVESVRALVEHALQARTRRATFAEMLDPAIAKPGLKRGEALRPDQVDSTKVRPALWWVKDHGVYLTSNGIPGLATADGRRNEVVYAEGFGPDADFSFVRSALGGDDFVEPIALDQDLLDAMADPDCTHLEIQVAQDSFSVLLSAKQRNRPSPGALH